MNSVDSRLQVQSVHTGRDKQPGARKEALNVCVIQRVVAMQSRWVPSLINAGTRFSKLLYGDATLWLDLVPDRRLGTSGECRWSG